MYLKPVDDMQDPEEQFIMPIVHLLQVLLLAVLAEVTYFPAPCALQHTLGSGFQFEKLTVGAKAAKRLIHLHFKLFKT